MLLTYHDYQALRQVQFEASRLLHNWLVRKGAEDEHEGKKGKWRTINGWKVFLPEGEEKEKLQFIKDEQDKLRKKKDDYHREKGMGKYKDKTKPKDKAKPKKTKPKEKVKEVEKTIDKIEEGIKPEADKQFEKEWEEKYAPKWNKLMQKGGNHMRAALSNMETPGSADKLLVKTAATDDSWLKKNLDRLNSTMGTEFTMDDYAAHNLPNEEQRETYVQVLNKLMDTHLVPEDFQDPDSIKEVMDVIDETLESGDYHPQAGDLRMWRNALSHHTKKTKNKIMAEYDKQLRSDPMKFMAEFGNDPGFKEVLGFQAELNAVRKKRYENATSLFRGTSIEELENLADKGYIGARKGKDAGLIATSVNKKVAQNFADRTDSGVIFEYDKEEIGKNANDVNYNYFSDKEYEANGHTVAFRDEEEYVIFGDKKIKPKKLKIHVLRSGEVMEKSEFKRAFGHLGEITFESET